MTASFVLMFAIVLGGCAATLAGGTTGGATCETVKVIRPTSKDVDGMSDSLKSQITAQNEFLEKACEVKP